MNALHVGIRIVEVDKLKIALVEWSTYVVGQSMAGIAKRLGCDMVMLLGEDVKAEDLTQEEIEALAVYLLSAAGRPYRDELIEKGKVH